MSRYRMSRQQMVVLLLNNQAADPDAVYLSSILAYTPIAFYDASISDVWQDSAGTTPAVADADVVGRWDDLSGNGYHVSQGTTANKPTLRTGVQNSLPGIRFDGSDDRLINNTIAQAQPTTEFVVVKFSSIAADRYVYDNASGGTGRHALFSETGITEATLFAGSSLSSTGDALTTDTTLWIGIYNGASSALYKNAGAAATGNAGAGNISRRVLGTNQGASQTLQGDIYTYIVFAGALNDTDRAAIRDLINARWAVY